MKSTMSHSFSVTPQINIPRSTFDRSHGHKTTFDGSYLIPIFTDLAVPGDTFSVKTAGFARLATPEFPVMDNMYMDTFWFAVPIRQIWTNFRKFCGEQEDPGDSIDYTLPTCNSTSYTPAEESLADYFGWPVGTPVAGATSLYHRAYFHIFNEWFRDQNLQNSQAVPVDDGPDVMGTDINRSPRKRGKRHDYFTSCLPWPQKGDSVSLPLGTEAPVSYDAGSGNYISAYDTTNSGLRRIDASGAWALSSTTAGVADAGELYADLSNATAATINELREAFQIQRLLERDARAGTRYSEIVKSHFGVDFIDVTYRPEYLGGGSTPININPVPSSYDDGTTSTKGELGAFGTASFNGHGFVKSFTEHCIVMGLVNVRADLTYSQGLDRIFSYSTRYDFYWPALAQIGEQAVLNKEIYLQNTSADDEVFGYQERYAEMRYKKSLISGKFRHNATGSLNAWHLSEEFGSLPTLGDTFIQDSAVDTIDRVIATSTEPQFIADFWFDYKAARPMPLYGTPGNLDRL